MKENRFKPRYARYDIPLITLLGAAAGFFLIGFIMATLGAVSEAGEGEIFSLKAIVGGLSCVLLSAVILFGLAPLYYWLVPNRFGAVYPQFNGFGLLLAFLALYSAVFTGMELSFWIAFHGGYEKIINFAW